MNNIVSWLAVLFPISLVCLIYYRAGLKRSINKLNKLEFEQENSKLPGIELFYDIFISNPVLTMGNIEQEKLNRKYIKVSNIIKYLIISSIIINIARVIIINFWDRV